jgi:3-oxoacyl-[acyl-carrier protein] reductase
MKDLEGKGIIVTGATRGISRAIALEAARRGANVAFRISSEQQAEEMKSEIVACGVKAMAFTTDVADLKEVRAMVNAAKAEFGRLDAVVNNAGLTRDKLLVMMSEEDWSAVIQTNLTGAFNVARASAHHDEGQARAIVCHVDLRAGRDGGAGELLGLQGRPEADDQGDGQELGPLGVRVNAVALGFIETDMTAVLSPEHRAKALEMIPLGQFGKVEGWRRWWRFARTRRRTSPVR